MLVALAGCDGTSPGADAGRRDGSPSGLDSSVDAGPPINRECLSLIPLRLWVTNPSAVAMLYRIEDCDGRTVSLVPGEGESVFDYYTLTENDSSLSSEAIPQVDLSQGQRVYVSLLLDFSDSTRPVESELLGAARSFVEQIIAASDKVYVGIRIFDGRPSPVTIELPTRDLDTLGAALTSLEGYSDPDADSGSTDLHGAFVQGVGDLQRWQESVIAANDLGIVTSGYTVVFTDGRDTAERVTESEAADAVARGAVATGSGGELANVQTYAVALQGSDYDAAARSALVTIAGGERQLYEGSLEMLEDQFRALAARIANQARDTHLLSYCSAARSGAREVRLGIAPAQGTGLNRIRFEFSADGFSAGCSEFIRTICDGRTCGGFNCGACDDATESCRTDTGQCQNACVAEDRCSGETITNALGYEQVCGGGTLRECGTQCADTASDPDHCGACGNACPAGTTCASGSCVCPGGGISCGGVCVDEQTDGANCGACGNACPSDAPCVDGACRCPGGGIACGGACTDLLTDAQNCGECGARCAVDQACVAGECACPSGWIECAGRCRDPLNDRAYCGDCATTCFATGEICSGGACACSDPAQTVCGGSCVDTATDSFNCGTCGNRCANTCVGGLCQCPGGQTACPGEDPGDDGVCVDTSGSTLHCGACGNACPTGASCVLGACLCPGGGVDCAGTCAVLATSTSHCGACGNACPSGATCASGACDCPGDVTTACGLSCVDLTRDPSHCGACDDSCAIACSDGACTVAVAGAASVQTNCARLSDGGVYCWGERLTYVSGPVSGTGRSTNPIVGLTGALDVAGAVTSGGERHFCVVRADRTVACWGYNGSGQLGDNTITPRSALTTVSGLTGAASLALGDRFSCARLTAGTVRCWGLNTAGQLGDGTTTGRRTPVAVSGLSGVAQLVAGRVHACALSTGGTVSCWGYNNRGQLGDGTTTTRLVPTAVPGLSGVVSIAASEYTTCAALGDGTVQCWGDAAHGQLGDGGAPTASRATPGPVLGLTGATRVYAGFQHLCATRTDGSLACWGYNYYQQLGSVGDGRTPRLVSSLPEPVVHVFAGTEHTCATLMSGAVWCWGSNDTGQLGRSDASRAPGPVVW